jgi:hypothetical protein
VGWASDLDVLPPNVVNDAGPSRRPSGAGPVTTVPTDFDLSAVLVDRDLPENHLNYAMYIEIGS